ncbi:hypothetical protein GGX14DRAFT_393640 [Mycena pura]|uniref:Uncharacterized protein n=1 Tax=Mycena pura TaxID=153505 RepID=A0AAD6VNF4_9AGAR|nr:hypothetical protein GGX14DRAFT_393640 [Mycena pura]
MSDTLAQLEAIKQHLQEQAAGCAQRTNREKEREEIADKQRAETDALEALVRQNLENITRTAEAARLQDKSAGSLDERAIDTLLQLVKENHDSQMTRIRDFIHRTTTGNFIQRNIPPEEDLTDYRVQNFKAIQTLRVDRFNRGDGAVTILSEGLQTDQVYELEKRANMQAKSELVSRYEFRERVEADTFGGATGRGYRCLSLGLDPAAPTTSFFDRGDQEPFSETPGCDDMLESRLGVARDIFPQALEHMTSRRQYWRASILSLCCNSDRRARNPRCRVERQIAFPTTAPLSNEVLFGRHVSGGSTFAGQQPSKASRKHRHQQAMIWRPPEPCNWCDFWIWNVDTAGQPIP